MNAPLHQCDSDGYVHLQEHHICANFPILFQQKVISDGYLKDLDRNLSSCNRNDPHCGERSLYLKHPIVVLLKEMWSPRSV